MGELVELPLFIDETQDRVGGTTIIFKQIFNQLHTNLTKQVNGIRKWSLDK